MLALECGDGFEFALGFGFDRFGFLGIKDGFEFFFLSVQAAQGLDVVEGEAAFLNPGMAFERRRFSGPGTPQFQDYDLICAKSNGSVRWHKGQGRRVWVLAGPFGGEPRERSV